MSPYCPLLINSGLLTAFFASLEVNPAMWVNNAKQYVEGIVLSDLKNIERISETLDSDYHKLQHFISDSNLDARGVMDEVARNVSLSLPRQTLTGLLIDESGWVKKGDKSVGVGHQYCGNVGKKANSQVAVFGCLCNGNYASLVDSRLYLPESWCQDQARCDEAGIPYNERVFKTKLNLALDIIKHQVSLGIKFDYIGADGLCGNDAAFARSIDNMGLIYMLDIHSDQKIFLQKPELFVPEKKGAKGPSPKRLKASTPEMNVREYFTTLDKSAWETIEIRHSAKGVLKGGSSTSRRFIFGTKTSTLSKPVYWLFQSEKQRTVKKSSIPLPLPTLPNIPNRQLPTCRPNVFS